MFSFSPSSLVEINSCREFFFPSHFKYKFPFVVDLHACVPYEFKYFFPSNCNSEHARMKKCKK